MEMPRFWDFDVQEKDNETVVRAEMPGFDKDDIQIEVQGDLMTIRAEKKEEHAEEGREARAFRSFQRTVTLSEGVNADKVDASYSNGVLELRIPWTERKAAKRVAIRGGEATPKSEKKMSGSQPAASRSEAEKSNAKTVAS